MGIWWQTGLTPIKPPPPDGPLARHAHRTCQGRAELPRHSIPSAADPRIIFRKPIPICRSAGFGKGLPESRDWPARACFRDLCPKPANFLAYRCRRRPAVPRCHQLRPMSTCQTRDRSEGPQGPIDLIRTSQRLGELRPSQPVPEDSASVHSYPRFFRRVPRPRSAIPHGHGSLQKTSPSPRRSHFDPYSLAPIAIVGIKMVVAYNFWTPITPLRGQNCMPVHSQSREIRSLAVLQSIPRRSSACGPSARDSVRR